MRKHIVQAALALAVAAGPTFAQKQASPPPPDNTGANKRDASGETQTAEKQGNNQADRKLLQAVRKSVMADKELSTYAQNVKILARGGVVTLRGPVKNEAEKLKIGQLAEQAGATKVDNRLEIAPAS